MNDMDQESMPCPACAGTSIEAIDIDERVAAEMHAGDPGAILASKPRHKLVPGDPGLNSVHVCTGCGTIFFENGDLMIRNVNEQWCGSCQVRLEPGKGVIDGIVDEPVPAPEEREHEWLCWPCYRRHEMPTDDENEGDREYYYEYIKPMQEEEARDSAGMDEYLDEYRDSFPPAGSICNSCDCLGNDEGEPRAGITKKGQNTFHCGAYGFPQVARKRSCKRYQTRQPDVD